jgi:hypothetical protein
VTLQRTSTDFKVGSNDYTITSYCACGASFSSDGSFADGEEHLVTHEMKEPTEKLAEKHCNAPLRLPPGAIPPPVPSKKAKKA